MDENSCIFKHYSLHRAQWAYGFLWIWCASIHYPTFLFILWPADSPSSRRLCRRDTAPVSLTPSKGHLPSFLPHLEPAIPPRSRGSFNSERGLRKHKVDDTRADCFQYFSVKKARKYILSGRKITNHEWILLVPTETSNQGFLNVFASIFVSVLCCKSCFLTAQTWLLVFFILNAKYVTCT